MVWAILLLALALRLVSLNQSFWLDEAAQAVISTKNIFKVDFSSDFQPPFFYLITHFWQKLGLPQEFFLRLVSLIFGILTIYLTYLLTKRLFNEKVALLSTLFLSTAPFHIYYSQEYRMYSLLTLLVLLSWYFFWQKKWLNYILVSILAIFTHYFAFLAILSQLISVLTGALWTPRGWVNGHLRGEVLTRYLISLIAVFAPFLFWLPTFIKQVKTAQILVTVWPKWQEVANISFLKFPALTLAKFTVGMISFENKIFYGGIVFFVGLIFLYATLRTVVEPRRLIKKPPRLKTLISGETSLLLSYFFLPLILTWLSSLFISATTPARIQFVLPAFYGLIAVGLLKDSDKQKTPAVKRYGQPAPGLFNQPPSIPSLNQVLLSILLLFNITFSLIYLKNPKFHREDWRGAVSLTDSLTDEKTVVLSEFHSPWAPMAWYSKKIKYYSGSYQPPALTDKSIDQNLGQILADKNKIILYSYLFEVSDPQRRVEEYLKQNSFALKNEYDFRGVGIIKIFKR